jgi:hypothetical protein
MEMRNPPPQQLSKPLANSDASLSDILTAIKNLVAAVNNASQIYLNVNGVSTTEAITAPTILKGKAGRIASVSVIVGGSTTGMIYDASQLSILTAPLYVIPTTVSAQPYVVNLPTDTGILVVPGTGQTVTVSWS